MRVTSTSSNDGDYLVAMDHVLADKYAFGCSGGNRSPQLAWSEVTEGARSFAVTCFDPDAPTGSGFWHWVVANIPADVRSLEVDAENPASGKLPAGAVTMRNDLLGTLFGRCRAGAGALRP